MKSLYIIMLMVIAAGLVHAQTVKYRVDPEKSEVRWTGYAAAGAYAPTGTIKIKAGDLMLKSSALASARIIVDMTTLSHEKAELQDHLKSKDFFAVDKYPEAEFVLTGTYNNTATGKLTIKGVTQKISFPYSIEAKDGSTIIKAELKVDRTQFGIKYNSASYFQDLGSYAIKNDFNLVLNLALKVA